MFDLPVGRVPFSVRNVSLSYHVAVVSDHVETTMLPIPVVLLAPDFSMTTLVLSVALPGAVQFAIGNVIEPKVMGNSLDLHPVVILLALIFWGMLWGTVGMLLATPITAVLKIVLERTALTAVMAEVLAGRLDFLKQDRSE